MGHQEGDFVGYKGRLCSILEVDGGSLALFEEFPNTGNKHFANTGDVSQPSKAILRAILTDRRKNIQSIESLTQQAQELQIQLHQLTKAMRQPTDAVLSEEAVEVGI